jgi:GntR family transcriptional repressor for pyruvate dehydrogenase complex
VPARLPKLSAEDRQPLSIRVAQRLRDAIVRGDLNVDEELPSEKELGEQLGVGRSTIREALRILQAQGLVSGGDTVSTSRPRVSSENTLASAAGTMANALHLGRIPLNDLVELRVLIEGAIVESACIATPRELAEAGAALAEMSSRAKPRTRTTTSNDARVSAAALEVEIETFRSADLRFHNALASAAGNAAFGLVMSVLRDAISQHLGEQLHRVAEPRKAMAELAREHAAILDAIVRNKPKLARDLVTRHIHDFYAESRA